MKTHRLWDIFCTVIDNHGDLGVCWRLTRQLRDAGQRVRLWVDDASALAWMAPTAYQEPGIEVRPWEQASQASNLQSLPPADVWIEVLVANSDPAIKFEAIQRCLDNRQNAFSIADDEVLGDAVQRRAAPRRRRPRPAAARARTPSAAWPGRTV